MKDFILKAFYLLVSHCILKPNGAFYTLLCGLFLFFASTAEAQTLEIGEFVTGTYANSGNGANGSEITVPIKITGCFNRGNKFELVMSDKNGNFGAGNEKIINTAIGLHFATFVNGIIPGGTAAGTYKLRVRATSPATTVDVPGNINVVSGIAPMVNIDCNVKTAGEETAFGFCDYNQAGNLTLTNKSINASSVSSKIYKNNTLSDFLFFSFTSAGFPIQVEKGYFTAVFTATGANGTISTKSYLILNCKRNFAINLEAANECLDQMWKIRFTTVGDQSVFENYPGYLYNVNWDDGSKDTVTVCELGAEAIISHVFPQNKSSCDRNPILDGIQYYNQYKVVVTGTNVYCNPVPTTKLAKVSLRPVINIEAVQKDLCVGKPVEIKNNSKAGEAPNVNAEGCNNATTYTWYVDGTLVKTEYNTDLTPESLIHTFNTPGQHKIKVVGTNGDGCTSENEITICISDIPKPKFKKPASPGFCAPVSIFLQNETDVSNLCNFSYEWKFYTLQGAEVAPNSSTYSFIGGTSPTTRDANIQVNGENQFIVKLRVGSVNNCGFYEYVDTLVVAGNVSAEFKKTFPQVCQNNVIDFADPISEFYPTYKGIGSQKAYTWTITPADYTFVNGTNANSPYPKIMFTKSGTFKIKVKFANECSDAETALRDIIVKESAVFAPNERMTDIDRCDYIQGSTITVNLTAKSTISGQSGIWTCIEAPEGIDRLAINNTGISPRGSNTTVASLRLPSSQPGRYLLQWTITNSAGCGSFDTVAINIYPKLEEGTAVKATVGDLCAGRQVGLKLTQYGGEILRWQASTNGGSSWTDIPDTKKDTIIRTINIKTSYRAVLRAGGSCGITEVFSAPVEVDVFALPAPGTLTASTSVACSGDNIGTVKLNGHEAGANLKWLRKEEGGAWEIIAGQTSSELAFTNLLKTTRYQVEVTKGACPSYSDSVTITVNKRPVFQSQPDQFVCSGALVSKKTFSIKEVVPNVPVSYQWYTLDTWSGFAGMKTTDSIPRFIPVNTTQTHKIISFKVSPTFTHPSGPCAGVEDSLRVIVLPTVKLSALADTTVCSGATITRAPAHQVELKDGSTLTYRWRITGAGLSSVSSSSAQGEDNLVPSFKSDNATSSTVTGTVEITPVYNLQGHRCEGETIRYNINISPGTPPKAGRDTAICNTTTFRLNANVPPAGITGTWSTSPQNNVTISNPNDPTATVTGLVAGNTYTFTWTFVGGNCSTSDDINVTILDKLVAKFSKSSAGGCEPASVTFTNTSSPANGLAYKWKLNNTVVSTDRDLTLTAAQLKRASSINSDTTHFIKLIIEYPNSACAKDSVVDSVSVYGKPKAVFTPSKTFGCGPLDIIFTNQSKGSKFIPTDYVMEIRSRTQTTIPPVMFQKWEDNPYKTFTFDVAKVDTFVVKLKAKNACTPDYSVDSVSIIVHPNSLNPLLVASGQYLYGCAPHGVVFSNNTEGANLFKWEFEDGSPIIYTTNNDPVTHIFDKGGVYNVKMTASNGCSFRTATVMITVDEANVDFTLEKSQYCKNEALRLNITNPNAHLYTWDFGDGETAIGTSPSHSYQNPGTYVIKLSAIKYSLGGAQCTRQKTLTITVVDVPQANFTSLSSANNCSPYAHSVRSISPNPYFVEWDFGDPGSQNNNTAGVASQHIYQNAGTYQVKMKVYNSAGCADSIVQTVVVKASPKADFAIKSPGTNSICGRAGTLSFENKSSTPTSGTFTYTWYKNNVLLEPKSTVKKDLNSVPFLMPANQTYPHYDIIKLVVENAITGCTDTKLDTIFYQALPQADFELLTQAAACAPLQVQVRNKSKNADAYQWFLNGTLVAFGTTPDLPVLDQPNRIYKLKLRALSNNCGFSETPEITISTYPKPSAAFTLENDLGCNGSLRLKVTSNTTSGATSYKWEYDEGPAQTGLIPQERAFGTGDHWVRLIADNGLCRDTLQKNFKVIDLQIPVIKPSVDAGCGSITVKFTSTAPDDVSYEWDFGVLGQSSLKEPVKVFNYQDGNKPYPVTLTIRYGICVVQSGTRFINVSGPPVADFAVSPDSVIKAPNFTFDFINRSSADATRCIWSFGDGKVSYEKNPTHKYPAIGRYQVKLTVRNENGCDSTMVKYVRVDTIPCYMQVPNAFEPGSLHPELQTFRPKALGLTTYSIRVFNRWGEMLWQSNKLDESGSPMEGWDGTIKGAPAPQGVYVWEISGSFADGTEWKGMSYSGSKGRKIRNGSVTLIR